MKLLFLEEILKSISVELNDRIYLSKFPKNNLDVEGNNQKIKQKFIGCTNTCKLCLRKCDEDHSIGNEKLCRCYTGHRFKVFGGSKIEGTNIPSFMFCDKMNDNDQIIFKSIF